MGVSKLFEVASRADKAGMAVTRLGMIVVLFWIGGLKAFPYEAGVAYAATTQRS